MGIIVLGLSYDSPNRLKAFKKKFKLPFILLSDSDKSVSKSFGASGLLMAKRKTFIVNEKGKISRVYEKVNVNTHAGKILKDLLPVE